MPQPGQIKVKVLVKVPPVFITTKVLAYKKLLMKPKEFYISIYVLLVGQKMESTLHTHNLSVENDKAKTSKDGHAKVETCHHSRLFVKSNWNPNLDHGPFSSPGNMKSVF